MGNFIEVKDSNVNYCINVDWIIAVKECENGSCSIHIKRVDDLPSVFYPSDWTYSEIQRLLAP